MGKIRFLKVLGISLFLLVSLFFTANCSLAEKPWVEFGGIDEPADDAQFIRWEIKAEEAYDVVVYMEDDDGNEFSIVFRTRDNENTYDASDNDRLVVGIGKEDDYYFDGNSIRIYESKSFTYLTSKHSSENAGITYNFDDDTTINKIVIYGEDFRLYSISLADNDYFDDLCWHREAIYWGNLLNFQNDNGKISNNTSIYFSSSYIRITEKETGSYTPPVYGGIYGGLYGYGLVGIYGSGLYGGMYGGLGYSGGGGPTYGGYGGLGGLGYSSMYGNYGPGWGSPPYGGYNSYSSSSTPPLPYYQSNYYGSYPVTNINPYVNPYPWTVGSHYYGPWNSGAPYGYGSTYYSPPASYQPLNYGYDPYNPRPPY